MNFANHSVVLDPLSERLGILITRMSNAMSTLLLKSDFSFISVLALASLVLVSREPPVGEDEGQGPHHGDFQGAVVETSGTLAR